MQAVARNCSPDVEVSELAIAPGKIFVVRDDYLPGGTKQRAAVPFLRDCLDDGFREFVYASPFSGFAQVALAASCRELGVRCVLFCEQDQTAGESGVAHEFTELARSLGAVVHLTPELGTAEHLSSAYEQQNPVVRLKIPLGFDVAGFKHHLGLALTAQWDVLCGKIGGAPDRVWIPVGSGTLSGVFRQFLPSAVQLRCVDVHVLPTQDSRIRNVMAQEGCHYYSAPERFAESVRCPPAIASNRFYDAKLWQFLLTEAQSGDVWWNVAR